MTYYFNMLRIFFVFSAGALTFALSSPYYGKVGNVFSVIGTILSILIWIFIEMKFNFLQRYFNRSNKNIVISSGFITLLIIYYNKNDFVNCIYKQLFDLFELLKINFNNILPLTIFIILSMSFTIFVFSFYALNNVLPLIKEFVKNMEKSETIFFVVWTFVVSIFIIIFYSKTTIFYSPHYLKENISQLAKWDVIYSLDTPYMIENNTFFSAQVSDITHPLFSLILLPINGMLRFIESIFHNIDNEFIISFAIFNLVILNIIAIMLKRILKSNWVMMLFAISHPCIIFSITSERYQMSVFSILCFVYLCIDRKYKECTYIVPILGGTTITNMALIVFSNNFDDKIKWFKSCFKNGVVFLIGLIIFGRTASIATMFLQINSQLDTFVQKTLFIDKLKLYTHFFASTLFATPYTVIDIPYLRFTWQPVNSVNILGLILIIMVLISFYLNKESYYAQICFYWTAFSFILIPIVGWAVWESQYFAILFNWAIISLIYMGLCKICNKNIKNIIISVLIISMIIVNFKSILDLVAFGINYYPVIK